MNKDKLSDLEYIVIITPFEEADQVADAGIEGGLSTDEVLHASPLKFFKDKFLHGANARKFEDLEKDWKKLTGQTRQLLKTAEEDMLGGMKLDEISFVFGLSAKGNIGLVSAGASSSITMKFKRK